MLVIDKLRDLFSSVSHFMIEFYWITKYLEDMQQVVRSAEKDVVWGVHSASKHIEELLKEHPEYADYDRESDTID